MCKIHGYILRTFAYTIISLYNISYPMSTRFGLREADIARREESIVSWLGFRDHMPGKELASLYGEWVTGPHAYQVGMLTQLALDNLAARGTVHATESEVQGVGFSAFSLAEQSAADSIDPTTVELVPRELVLMGSMDIRRDEAQTAAQLDERLGLDQQAGPDAWRTEACLGHLAKLGLLEAVQNPPGAYRLPQAG